jgi:hypothetical protein
VSRNETDGSGLVREVEVLVADVLGLQWTTVNKIRRSLKPPALTVIDGGG